MPLLPYLVVSATTVKPSMSAAVETTRVMTTSIMTTPVVTVMHAVMAMAMMVGAIGTFRRYNEARLDGNSFFARAH